MRIVCFTCVLCFALICKFLCIPGRLQILNIRNHGSFPNKKKVVSLFLKLKIVRTTFDDKYKYAEILSRVLFGSIFMIVGGLNGFFDFVPGGQKSECESCSLFMNGLDATGYMFPLVKISEFIIGGMILFNLYTALAIVLASPIVINIFFYNLFLDQRGIVEATILVACLLYIAWRKKPQFTSLFIR